MSQTSAAETEYVVEAITGAADDLSLPLVELEPVVLSTLRTLASQMQRLPADVTASAFAESLWSGLDARTAESATQPVLFDLAP